MAVDGITMSGELVLSNESGDSRVILSGSDNMNTSIEELKRFEIVLQHLPREITELKSDTYSVKFIGPYAIDLLLEVNAAAIENFSKINTDHMQ